MGFRTPSKSTRSRVWLLLVVGLMGSIVSGVVYYAFSLWERRLVTASFRYDAERRLEAIREEFQKDRLLLTSIEAFRDASGAVGEREFESFSQAFLGRQNGLVALAEAARIPRKTGGYSYPIRFLAGCRETPLAKESDLALDPIWQKAILRAEQSGSAAAISRADWAGKEDHSRYLLLFAPVHSALQAREGMGTGSAAVRIEPRKSRDSAVPVPVLSQDENPPLLPQGVAVALFRIDEIVAAVPPEALSEVIERAFG